MSAHTPGPWKANRGLGGRFLIGATHVGCQGWVPIASTSADVGDAGGEELMANARLIAAAPELLEALKGLVGAVGVRIDDPRIALFDAAKAAIAKATGGES